MEKCTCGHHAPTHYANHGHCCICDCEKFTVAVEGADEVEEKKEKQPGPALGLASSRLTSPEVQGALVQGALRVLDMLAKSRLCWCNAGSSSGLTPDHTEACIQARALYLMFLTRVSKRD